jgi:hypothetical protein
MRTHPHVDASYRILEMRDGSFGVEVSIPGSHPTTVTSFKSAIAANAWITLHRQRVVFQSQTGTGFGFRAPPRAGQRSAENKD